MAPRTIDVVPDPSYLAWMQWVQREVKAWLGRAGGVCRELGMSSWLYWGDCHVGMEPYCGSLDETIREIDKPSSDAVTARALADFPGAVKRRLRVDWLFPHVAASDASPDRWLNQWARSRRGLLMRPAEGIYWMPFPGVVAGRDAGVREDVVETLAEIGDEFRLIGDRLAGSSAFTNDLDVYVAHSWGSVYSWRPWGSPILTHLTDLPVRVHFISFAEIEAKGIPADADALMLYGMPNTAWSGGRWWASGKVAAAVTDFVRKGGGLLALQAPSHLDTPQPHWALGDVLGVRAEGPSQRQTTQTDLSQLADTGAEAEKGTQGRAGVRLRLLKAAEGHWMTGGIAEIAGLQETVRVTALPGAKVLCAASGGEGAVPGVVLSEPGKGRVVYLSGWSAEYAFSRLMRRAVFWVARREADCDRLDISGGEDLYVYAFPNERVLVLANNAAAPAKATVRCDPSIFGAKGTLRLVDAATGQTAWEGDAEKLRPGILVETIPRCARLLQLR
jgi:hypothetical protein